MQYDKTRPEDLDTKLEDHILDSLRYLVMARPITLNLEKKGIEISKQWYKDFNPAEVLKSLETQRNLQNFK